LINDQFWKLDDFLKALEMLANHMELINHGGY